MRRRSRHEILFRLRQEAANVYLLIATPALPDRVWPQAPLPGLPDLSSVVERLRHSRFEATVERLANEVLAHRFPLFGTTIEAGREIRWRRDYQHGIETGTQFFRRIPYLDFERAGDHKLIWELNRHQHLVLLAQAFRLTQRSEFLGEIEAQLASWFAANPYLRGINWASALEVAFRALSWIWVFHLAGDRLSDVSCRQLLNGVYRHARFLERNLSLYFSPNTHLLGEAVALHAIGRLLPEFPGARGWELEGRRILEEQIAAQVREDGSYFEQSTYYHVYALDMFLLHATLAETSDAYRARVLRMAEYLEAVLGLSRTLPFVGDDDGGRLFHPYGARDRFGRATLATCGVLFQRPEWIHDEEELYEQAAWWLGEKALNEKASGEKAIVAPSRTAARTGSRLFTQAGTAVLAAGELHVIADAGPFGPWRAGHSHSDSLQVLVRHGEEELLIDPGTYTYVADPAWRNRFRGSAAHNTVRVDGKDQAAPAGPFFWCGKPRVKIRKWASEPDQDFLDAECRSDGIVHRRRILLLKPAWLVVLDEIAGPDGEHVVEQFWHCGEPVEELSERRFRIGNQSCLILAGGGTAECERGGEAGWRSPVFGQKIQVPVIRVSVRTSLPARVAAVLDVFGKAGAAQCKLEEMRSEASLILGDGIVVVRFPEEGLPRTECLH